MFEISDLNHVNIVVRNVANSKHFYCDLLGMKDLPRPADLTIAGAWLRSGSAEIHLIQENFATHAPGDLSSTLELTPEVDLGSSRHFSLVINDTDELLKRLQENNIPIAFGPIKRFNGIVQTYCFDPDGHLIEFTQFPEHD